MVSVPLRGIGYERMRQGPGQPDLGYLVSVPCGELVMKVLFFKATPINLG